MSTMTTGHYLNNELFINGGLFWDEGVRIQHFQPVQIHVNFVVGSCCVSPCFVPLSAHKTHTTRNAATSSPYTDHATSV